MGRYQHPLLNKETGVYSYDQLVVLRKTRMAAALLEAGSINQPGRRAQDEFA
jgi:N-acetylmuramoyl-L-alanine amidase